MCVLAGTGWVFVQYARMSVQCPKIVYIDFLKIISMLSAKLLTIQERQMTCLIIMNIRTMITVVDVTIINYY